MVTISKRENSQNEQFCEKIRVKNIAAGVITKRLRLDYIIKCAPRQMCANN